MESRVFVYYTGGTIGMVIGPDGKLVPGKPGDFTEGVRRHPELYEKEKDGWFVLPLSERASLSLYNESKRATDGTPASCKVLLYRIEEAPKLIDSTDMLPSDWSNLAKKITDKNKNDQYDGYVILHGTDTMAYTSSALSFLFIWNKIPKPIILTGAQRTLTEPRSDAVDNILGSLLLAGCYGQSKLLQQVCLYFNNKLFQGNRVTKFNSNSFKAFTSPKFPPLVEMGVNITVLEPKDYHDYGKIPECLCPTPPRTFSFSNTSSDARLLYLFPGIQEGYVRNALKEAGGIVLASFGAGNVPDFQWLKDAFEDAKKREVLMFNCSQSFKGTVLPIYDVAAWLKEAGVVSGNDITPEAALTKMVWVLQIPSLSYNLRRMILGCNVCGEMTVAPTKM